MMCRKSIDQPELCLQSTRDLIERYNERFGQKGENYVLHNIRLRQDMKWLVEARSKELGMNASNFIRLAVFKLLQEI